MTINTNSSNLPPFTSNPPNSDDINSVHHPLFFRQNDHPSLILVSKKLTGSDNYNSWKRSMMIALNARNKLKLINREFEEPTTDSPIMNNLSFVNTVFALWNELNEHYAQLDGHRIYQGHDGSITYESLFGGLYALSPTPASTPTTSSAATTTPISPTTLATSTSTTL
ncbi:cysteine-rich receptor-like protein kinase 8 [Tanacetum coccineum]